MLKTLLAAGLGLALAGCQSFVIPETEPLTKVSPAGSPSISEGGYRLAALPVKDGDDTILLALAFSGGGKRSSAYSYGVLEGLRDRSILMEGQDRRLLDEVDIITSVSGGSFTSSYYGLYRDRIFTDYKEAFLNVDIDAYIFGVYLLPWNWEWLVNPFVGTNDYMAALYDRLIYKGATYADMVKQGRPMIGVSATDITYGSVFAFTQPFFDLICSDLDSFPVARAVAASNGFPVLFSPITLESHRDKCGDRVPGWYAAVPPNVQVDRTSRLGYEYRNAEQYLKQGQTQYVHLMDGGIADNLALRGIIDTMVTLAGDAGGRKALELEKVTRVLLVSVDGEASQDTSWARERIVTGIGQIFANVSGAQIDRYNFETLLLAKTETEALAETIRKDRCAIAPTIDGKPCDDVKGMLLHLSLQSIPDEAERKRLDSIPTGLTIDPGDVDKLIEAGKAALLGSKELDAFLGPAPAN